MRLDPEERYDVEQAMNHRWMKEISPSTAPELSSNSVETPTFTPIESQDMSPPLVNHAPSKKRDFNPVFWSLRKNMSATLTGDFISEGTNSSQSTQIEIAKSQSSPRSDHITNSGVVDDIDEFSSDEDSKPVVRDNPGKKSRSQTKSKFPILII